MFEELFELVASPLGIIAAIGLVGTEQGRVLLRKATKFIIRTGVEATENVKEIYREVQEEDDEAALTGGNGGGRKRVGAKSSTNN